MRTVEKPTEKMYDRLIKKERHRKSLVEGRTLEEEVDADRGRVLFCPAFRRLQNKTQVFALERNAAIRSRLTHSLEVSSIGRYIAQQAIKAFSDEELDQLGIRGKERVLITLVETSCLLHDIGNPPFGHFGERAISDWFHVHASELQPNGIGGQVLSNWTTHFDDFRHFDGNPQGFRIVTKLQAKEVGDLCGMNLTATTLASIVKYPWPTGLIWSKNSNTHTRKKAGYYHTEQLVAEWVHATLGLDEYCRHPLVFLMEAADDIAYCLSDIEDGIDKGLIAAREFAQDLRRIVEDLIVAANPSEPDNTDLDNSDLNAMRTALCDLEGISHDENPVPAQRFSGMEDFRAGLMRYLSRNAGIKFRECHKNLLQSDWMPLLRSGSAENLLKPLRDFAERKLYISPIVRDRELTAHAVLSGLFNAYLPLMTCSRERFELAIKGDGVDRQGRTITGEQSLISRLATKHMAVYKEEVRCLDDAYRGDTGMTMVLERIHRIRIIVDYVAGMTDDYAFQTFKLVSGMDTHRQ